MKRILASLVVVVLFLSLVGSGLAEVQQPLCSTVYLSDAGWSDPAVGEWDPVSKTATLTGDLAVHSIAVSGDGITLEGNGHTLTSCDGLNIGVVISGTGITVRNLTVQGFWMGIGVDNSTGVTVANCVSDYSSIGIYIEGCTDTVLSGNTVRSSGVDGILMRDSSGGTVSGNTAVDNGNSGLLVHTSTNLDIAGNTMSGNRFNFVLWGDTVAQYEHNVAADNLVEGRRVYYVRDAVGQVYDGLADAGTLYLVNCDGVTVRNTTLTHGADGVCLVNTHNSRLENIRVQEAGYGVRLVASNDNTIRDCTITGDMEGLHLQGSTGNQVYGNWFLSNATQAYVEGGSGNLFNLPAPTGGNYWTDWTGPDADGDGFVDSPYVFTGGQDDLPLSGPAPADTDAPVTSWFAYSGGEGGEWRGNDIQVTLDAVDIGASGVKGTEYGFDEATGIAYTGPFTVMQEGVTTVYFRSIDNAGNVEEAKSADVKIDKTPPVVTRGQVQGVAGNNGWYLSDVSIPYTASDALSGLAFPSDASFVLTASGEGEGIALNEGWWRWVADRAGNEARVGGGEYFNIDKTAPVLTQGAIEGEAGNDGWYRSDVTVTFGATDAVSGLADAADASFALTASGEGEAVSTGTREVSDVAGNVAMAGPLTFKIDKTPPVLIGTPTTEPNAAGWYNHEVTICWTASDALSGLDSSWVPACMVVGCTAPGPIVMPSIEARDLAGNEAIATVPPIQIDCTAPTIAITTPEPGAALPAGTALEFGAADDLSGLATLTATLDDGTGPVPVSSGDAPAPGVYTLVVRVSDRADNVATEARSFVVYGPDGGAVSGKGWIDSPVGAYLPAPDLTGKASFGFDSAYASGATVPTGQAEFELKAADLSFSGTGYTWLVVTGAKAQCEGVGTINGEGSYGFLLTVVDGKPDRLRIKIWDEASGDLVYDNQLGAADDADPAAAIGGGTIVVHVD